MWEVDRLVACGIEKRVNKVPWSQLDTSSEGSHYKFSVLISKHTRSRRGVCQVKQTNNFISGYVPPPLKVGPSQPPSSGR